MSADRLSFEHVAGGPWKGEAETSGFEAKKLVIECTSLFEAMRTAAVFFGELDREPEEDLAKVQAGVSLAEHDQALQFRDETIQRLVTDKKQLGATLVVAQDKIAELTAKIVEMNKPADPSPGTGAQQGGASEPQQPLAEAQEAPPFSAGQTSAAGTDPGAQQQLSG